MDPKRPIAPFGDRFAALVGDTPSDASGVRTVATQSHAEIRRWAAHHRAEPATGEATASGPAVRDINDGGARIRFNFPGFAPLRPITWDEWFHTFDHDHLLFLYEEADPDQRERHASASGTAAPLRYWVMKSPHSR